jgi:hypothetical protein
VDDRRYTDMADLFVPDGVWETAFGTATGRAEIEALMRRLMPPLGTDPRALHLTANVVIRLDGDRAEARSNWFVGRNRADGPAINAGGIYWDMLERHSGAWRFRHRRIDRFLAQGRMNE